MAKHGVKAYGIVILLENGTAKRFVGTGMKNSAHIEQTRMSAGKIYAVIKFFFFLRWYNGCRSQTYLHRAIISTFRRFSKWTLLMLMPD